LPKQLKGKNNTAGVGNRQGGKSVSTASAGKQCIDACARG